MTIFPCFPGFRPVLGRHSFRLLIMLIFMMFSIPLLLDTLQSLWRYINPTNTTVISRLRVSSNTMLPRPNKKVASKGVVLTLKEEEAVGTTYSETDPFAVV